MFFNLVGADTNDARKKLQADYSAGLATHRDSISLNGKLFTRIQTVYDQRSTLAWTRRAYAWSRSTTVILCATVPSISDTDKTTLKAMNAELANLGTTFNQNVLAEVNAAAVVVDDVKQLDGLSDKQIASAAEAAKSRKLDGEYVIALLNTTGQAPLTQMKNRELRKKIYDASVSRGSHGGQYDNTALVSRIMTLRADKAKLLGLPTYAAYLLSNQTAKTPEAVNAMLSKLGPNAVANAKREAADLQAMINKEQKGARKPTSKLEAWDWAKSARARRHPRAISSAAFPDAPARPRSTRQFQRATARRHPVADFRSMPIPPATRSVRSCDDHLDCCNV